MREGEGEGKGGGAREVKRGQGAVAEGSGRGGRHKLHWLVWFHAVHEHFILFQDTLERTERSIAGLAL